ncbi:hypothetical protein K9L63_00285 [Candidatus Gracilibacteria bacterium]|nr:hypothetical protein [Candidatus Gracilibacteria bacterium]
MEDNESSPEDEEGKDPLEESENARRGAEALEGGGVRGGKAGNAELGNVEKGVSNVGNLKQVEYKTVNGRTIEVDVSEREAAKSLEEAHREERLEADKAKSKLESEMNAKPELAQVDQEQGAEEDQVEGEKEEQMVGIRENADTWMAESGIDEDPDVGVGTNVG